MRIATSMSSSIRLTSESDSDRCSATRGCAARNAGRRGTTWSMPKARGALTRRLPAGSDEPMRDSACSMASSSSRAAARKRWPSSVRRCTRVERCSNCAPRRRSSWLTVWLTSGWLTPRAYAAAVKPPVSATALKTRISTSRSSLMRRSEERRRGAGRRPDATAPCPRRREGGRCPRRAGPGGGRGSWRSMRRTARQTAPVAAEAGRRAAPGARDQRVAASVRPALPVAGGCPRRCRANTGLPGAGQRRAKRKEGADGAGPAASASCRVRLRVRRCSRDRRHGCAATALAPAWKGTRYLAARRAPCPRARLPALHTGKARPARTVLITIYADVDNPTYQYLKSSVETGRSGCRACASAFDGGSTCRTATSGVLAATAAAGASRSGRRFETCRAGAAAGGGRRRRGRAARTVGSVCRHDA